MINKMSESDIKEEKMEESGVVCLRCESDIEEEKMESEVVCLWCGSTPCKWITYGKDIIEGGQEMYSEGENVENNKKRKAMYHLFTYLKYGHLGKGNRIPIPICVVEKIRETFPSPDGNYMGYISN